MRADIVKWNPINTRTSNLHSSIYIKPTLEILEFFNRSPNHKAVVKIGGTGHCHDNQNMFATIDKSSDVPNKRDNFYDSTGLYVITLNTLWRGFPLKNGHVEFQEGIVNDIIEYVSTCDKTSNNPNNSSSNEDKNNLKETYNGPQRYNGDNEDSGDNEDNEYNGNTKKCKSNGGFDNNILLISGLSLILIMILTLNN